MTLKSFPREISSESERITGEGKPIVEGDSLSLGISTAKTALSIADVSKTFKVKVSGLVNDGSKLKVSRKSN
jgi:hypothetical protein